MLQIKAPTVYVQQPGQTLYLRLDSICPHFLLRRKKRHFYACNRHARGFFFFIFAFSLYAGLTASAALVILAGKCPRKGTRALSHGARIPFFPSHTRCICSDLSVLTTGALQEYAMVLLWLSFHSVERRW